MQCPELPSIDPREVIFETLDDRPEQKGKKDETIKHIPAVTI